ncbi:carbohydrate ABC transporter permease [Paenibacillus contaminans]|uniref:Sugar ABC transporter permease n=1 Tax=Paenibacillus contaminans TaxID=450362 RepID=A0A329LUU5_9BACL|nr:sugar ABC transporter permease [Paenibacillus contaminans]RAV11741.1 sugar ABC transporter permease [Paenibacillus contaminans]
MRVDLYGDKKTIVRRMGLQKASVQRNVFLFVAIVPCLAGYILFTLYPNVMSVYYAFLNWDGITAAQFVGFDNFVAMVKDKFVWRALSHNLVYMLVVPAVTMLLSLILAYLLSNKGYREGTFYKVLFFFPNILSSVVIALLWAFIYDGSFGILNALLKLVGINNGEFYWLGDTRTALWALVLPMIWGGVGLYVVIFMNAMSGIPKSLYEAAVLEGASHMQRLFRITIPLMSGVIRVGVLFTVLGVLKGFETMLIMTNGGPEGSTDVIGLYMFNLAFGSGYHNYGYASAIGMFLFVILIGAKWVIDKYSPKDDVEF